jgi:hypothetical protein
MSTKSQIEQAMGLYDVPKAVTELDYSRVSNSLAMQIEAAQSLCREMEKAQAASREIGDIIAFQREFSSIAELQRHTEKALAFQREIDKARALQDLHAGLDKPELERKRQAFLSLRDENYIASLRLEGFDVNVGAAPTTLEALRSKYARR